MDIQFSVINGSQVPIYKQLLDKLASQIILGEVSGQTCLPPIRTVASNLGISVITVKRTWEELERMGLIYTVTGKGCFVCTLSEDKRTCMREKMAADNLAANAPFYKNLGVSKAMMHELIDKYFE